MARRALITKGKPIKGLVCAPWAGRAHPIEAEVSLEISRAEDGWGTVFSRQVLFTSVQLVKCA